MHDNVVYLGSGALYCHHLKEVRLSANIDTLRSSALGNGGDLKELKLPENLKVILQFSLPEKTDYIYISKNVNLIEEECGAPQKCFFVDEDNSYYCSENGILYTKDQRILIACPHQYEDWLTLPSTLERVANRGFHTCEKLTRVTFPESFKEFGRAAFYYCTGISRITFNCTTPPVVVSDDLDYDRYIFNFSNASNCDLYVPKGSRELYYNAYYASSYGPSYMWRSFKDIIELSQQTTIENVNTELTVNFIGEYLLINNITSPTRVIVNTINGRTLYDDIVSTKSIKINLHGKNMYIVKIGSVSQILSL